MKTNWKYKVGMAVLLILGLLVASIIGGGNGSNSSQSGQTKGIYLPH